MRSPPHPTAHLTTLRRGYDAYRHNVFGDTITVERKISATGTSGYALKDAAGRCTLWVASLLSRGGIVEVERKISATVFAPAAMR